MRLISVLKASTQEKPGSLWRPEIHADDGNNKDGAPENRPQCVHQLTLNTENFHCDFWTKIANSYYSSVIVGVVIALICWQRSGSCSYLAVRKPKQLEKENRVVFILTLL